MRRKFIEWQLDAGWAFHPCPPERVPECKRRTFFWMTRCRSIFHRSLTTTAAIVGQPPVHPQMMLLLQYASSAGVFSSRKILRRCAIDAAFRVIGGEDITGFRRLAKLRAGHVKHLQSLLPEVPVLCREAGLLKVRRALFVCSWKTSIQGGHDTMAATSMHF